MAFNTAHRALADAAMQVEAYRLYGRRASIPQNIIKASYQSSYRDDQRARPGSAKGWYEATANSTNRAIVEEANNAVQRAFQQHRVSLEGLDAATAAPMLAAFAAANGDNGEVTTQPVEISRRAMLGMGAAAAAVAMFTPTQAAADNVGYISTVRNGARGYSGSNAPAVIRGVGAGIRGNFEVTPGELNAPKGPVQA